MVLISILKVDLVCRWIIESHLARTTTNCIDMLSFGVDNKIIPEEPIKINAAKKRKKARKANKRARAQRRKK